MPSNKDRLYVVLYARGGSAGMPGEENKFHWALIVGPKDEGNNGRAMRFHAKERMTGPGVSQWEYEEREISIAPTHMLLIRILVAKIDNMKRFLEVVRNVPMRPDIQGWNCVWWVQEALESLNNDGKALGTSVVDWETVRNTAMAYVQSKIDSHRFDGLGEFDMQKAATFSLLENREIVP